MKHFRDLPSSLTLNQRLRRWGASVVALTALAVTACGGTTPSSATRTPVPTPVPPAGGQFTATGDIHLMPTLAATAITCSFPSLDGPEILMFVQTADQSLGGYITLSANEVFVRIGSGSGAAYKQRNWSGPGVTQFNAATGAHFNAQLSDTTPAGQNKGTIGTLTTVSGSVSCGNKTPGGGSITITGDSTGGAISGALTSMLVKCPVGQTFAIINGLTQVGSAPASVEIGGGNGTYFASISTSSGSFFYTAPGPNLYTVGSGHVIWTNAVLTQTGVAGAAGHKVTVNGDATCGT